MSPSGTVEIGDLVLSGDFIAIVIDIISDQWSDRFLILSDGEMFEVPWYQPEKYGLAD